MAIEANTVQRLAAALLSGSTSRLLAMFRYGNNPFAMGQSNPWFNQSNPYMAGSMSTPFMPPFGQNVGFFNQQFGTMPGYNPQYGAVGGFNPGFAGSNPYSFTALTPRQSLLGNVPLPGPGVSNHTRFNQVKDLYKAAKEDNEEGKDKVSVNHSSSERIVFIKLKG